MRHRRGEHQQPMYETEQRLKNDSVPVVDPSRVLPIPIPPFPPFRLWEMISVGKLKGTRKREKESLLLLLDG